MRNELNFIHDPEQAQRFIARYSRLEKEQLGVSQPVIDGRPWEYFVPCVREMIGKHEPEVKQIALHVMTAFSIRGDEAEPHLLMEYFPRGYPDPERVPPIFFSIGAREFVWGEMLFQTGVLAFLDGQGSTLLVQLDTNQITSVGVFLYQASAWCARQRIDPFDPSPFKP